MLSLNTLRARCDLGKKNVLFPLQPTSEGRCLFFFHALRASRDISPSLLIGDCPLASADRVAISKSEWSYSINFDWLACCYASRKLAQASMTSVSSSQGRTCSRTSGALQAIPTEGYSMQHVHARMQHQVPIETHDCFVGLLAQFVEQGKQNTHFNRLTELLNCPLGS